MEETSKKEFFNFKNSLKPIRRNEKTINRIKSDLTKIFEKDLKNGIQFKNPISKPIKNQKFFEILNFFPKQNSTTAYKFKFFGLSAIGCFAFYQLFVNPTSIDTYKNALSFFSSNKLDKDEIRTVKFPKEVKMKIFFFFFSY